MIEQQTITFDLADVVGLLWRRKLSIITCSLLGFGAALAIAFILPRTFIAEGQVVIRAESSVSSDPDHSFYSSVVNDAVVTTERDVLAARGLMARVAGSVPLPREDKPSRLKTMLDELETYLARVSGPYLNLSRLLIAGSNPAQDSQLTEEKWIDRVSRDLSTTADKGSSVISLRGATNDPQFSAAIVNRALALYMEDRLVAQQRSARNVEAALHERLQQTRTEIDHAEERVAALMQQPGMLESIEVPDTARELTLIGSRLAEAQGDLAARRAAYQATAKLRDAAHGNPAQLIAVLDQGSTSTSDLRREFTELQQESNRLSAQEGPSHPQYTAIRRALDGLVARLSGETERLIAQRQAEVASAEQVVVTLSKQYADLRQNNAKTSPALLGVDRERDSLANLRRIAGSIEDRLIAVAAQPVDPNARVLTWAQVPVKAAYPNKPLFAASGLLVGMVLSSALAIFRGYKQRIRPSVTYQAEVLAGARLLGSLPDLRGQAARNTVATIFQGVALEVENVCSRNGIQVLTITSGSPNEGKTTIAVNLALTLSKIGKRVLLINCDLHHPAEEAAAPWRGRQLRDLDSGDEHAASLPGVRVASGTDLHVVPTCSRAMEDPVSYLRSREFTDMIEAARGKYDLVLCDTPPVLAVPDAILVARASDAVLLVSEYSAGPNRTVSEEISRRIAASGRPICGVVVTKVSGGDMSFTSYMGYGRRRRARSMLGALASSELR